MGMIAIGGGGRVGRWLGLGLLALLFVGWSTAGAQDLDPPARVARLAEVEGQVWVWTPDTGDWIGAARNQPIAAGDRLATDTGARAELQIGSTTLRLDGGSELDVDAIDDARAAMNLREGSAWARVRDPAGAGRLEWQTDEGRFTVGQAGIYRLDRRGARTDLTVMAGRARYDGPNSGITIEAGQHAQFFIDAGGVAQYSLMAPAGDSFAAWNAERDRRSLGAIAERYVSPEMTGVAQLDAYGRWEQDPDQGAIWIPTAVAADWAPYAVGHWIYARPWGWTWVDDAPWGFAPFHYGRWLYARGRWGWAPGQRVARPVYAPALVAWVGTPGRGGPPRLGGGPAVGWVPLGPREVYVPGYRVSPRYAREVNLPNVRNPGLIDRVYANPQQPRDFGNRYAPRGLTFVPAEVLTDRRPVAPVAGQWRDTPWARDAAGGRGGFAPALAPVAPAPRAMAHGGDPRPPGVFREPRRAEADPRSGAPSVGSERPDAGEGSRGGGRAGFDPRSDERPGGDPRTDGQGNGRASTDGQRRDIAQPPSMRESGPVNLGGNGRPDRSREPTPPPNVGREPGQLPNAAPNPGQPPLDRNAGQPPFGGGTGQPPFGRGTGQPPYGRGTGQPPYGREAGGAPGLPPVGLPPAGPPPTNGPAAGATLPRAAPAIGTTLARPDIGAAPGPAGEPTMRAFPIRRDGEDRRSGREAREERGLNPRMESAPGMPGRNPAPAVAPPTAIERAPAPRAPEPPIAPRNAEPPRPAPPAGLAPPPAGGPRGESPRGGGRGEERRNEPGPQR